jgi:pyruvate dehydrogenase E2 component (dihydrolipoamide acetyltransferase)
VQTTTETPLENSAETRVPLSRIQRLTAERMLASKRSKPCFYLEMKADVTDLMGMRHRLSKAFGVKITSNAFFIHAMGMAAREYPLMVGRLVPGSSNRNGDGMIVHIAENVNVGFAVSTPQGLVVPVVHGAEGLSLAEIADQEKHLIEKARSNKLTLEDIEGETIALSNLGAYDIDSFLGIVPLPASTIVSTGKISLAAVPHEGRVAARKQVSLSLAVDHRVVPCDYAARFLRDLAERLSDPKHLL